MRAYGQKVRDSTVSTDFADGTPSVDSDPSQTTQVLMNLSVNAEDAVDGSEEKRITASISVQGDRVLVSVADTVWVFRRRISTRSSMAVSAPELSPQEVTS
jgi:C4-dicarboxylate-specific signal transduction histidine kinase